MMASLNIVFPASGDIRSMLLIPTV
jgi:hypothetical protein